MPDVKARCLDCNHTWETRKPSETIKRPWSSECGANGDAIEFDCDAEPTEARSEAVQMTAGAAGHRAVGPSRSIVSPRRDYCLDRLGRSGSRRGPERIRGTQLSSGFLETNYPALDELKAINDRVDELEAAVDEYAQGLDRIYNLEESPGCTRMVRSYQRSSPLGGFGKQLHSIVEADIGFR